MVFPRPIRDRRDGASTFSSISQSIIEDPLKHQGLAAQDNPSTSTATSRKINDSVYQLYFSSSANMDIVFFHGLQLVERSALHESTWKTRCPGAPIWPQRWLPDDYPDIRVLTVSYDGSMRKSDRGGVMDLYLIGESLVADLLRANVGQVGPVILVGHCFGGIVIKELCLFLAKAKDHRALAFLQKIRGIFYFATPHQGGFKGIIEKLQVEEGELVKFVRILNNDLSRINYEFQNLCNDHKWHISGVGETIPTDLGGESPSVIVEEGSARFGNKFICVNENHFSICQPREKTDSTYQFFLDFIGYICETFEDLEGDRQIMPDIVVGLLETWEGGEIETILERNSALGLWGMGGIGKTTLSKAIFNRKRYNFEFTLFVEDVKLKDGEYSPEFVERLLERVHRRGKKVNTPSDKSFLKGKDILVVLDDVNSADDRDIRLVQELQGFCSLNSRFILTSRNRQILSRVHNIGIVRVPPLDDSSSERLFRGYAIPNRDDLLLPQWQRECLRGIVEHCAGRPLILEIVGKYLQQTSGERDLWEQTHTELVAADDINAVGVDAVLSKLKVSYDSLGNEEKQMFLDAATFFQEIISLNRLWPYELRRRWSLREAKAVWGRKYGREAQRWKTLVDRSLVSVVAEDSAIKMHEHLVNLGQWLAKEGRIRIEESDPKRLSEALHERNHQLQEIHTIHCLQETDTRLLWNMPPIERQARSCSICKLTRKITQTDELCPHRFPRIDLLGLHQMKNLQYLQLDDCAISSCWKKVILPPSLVIFRCVNTRNNISFAACTNLVILIMQYFGRHLPKSICSSKNLQILYLEARDLNSLPELFGNLGNLKQLTFRCCFSLERLPLSLDGLQSLQMLQLYGCEKLVELPDSFGALRRLQVLKIYFCLRLVRLADSFGGLENLQVLEIRHCEKLVGLPASFGSLESIQELKIRNCEGLEGLPDSFGRLKSIQVVEMNDCKGLVGLPDSFGGLRSLKVLKIYYWPRLVRLPDSFDGLESLQVLEIRGCTRLMGLPDSLCGLKSLKELQIDECDGLAELPESFDGLESLQVLKLHVLPRLVKLPDSFCSLKSLQELNIRSVKLVRFPDSFGDLKSLKVLRIDFCTELVSLPDSFGNLKGLQVLSIEFCPKLERLPNSFYSLESLQTLRIHDCERLTVLTDSLGGLESLQRLQITQCGSTENLQKTAAEINQEKAESLQHPQSAQGGSTEDEPKRVANLNYLPKFRLMENPDTNPDGDALMIYGNGEFAGFYRSPQESTVNNCVRLQY